MKKPTVCVCLVAMGLALTAPALSAQTPLTLVRKLEALEARIGQLEDELGNGLAHATPAFDPGDLEDALALLRKQVGRLTAEVDVVKGRDHAVDDIRLRLDALAEGLAGEREAISESVASPHWAGPDPVEGDLRDLLGELREYLERLPAVEAEAVGGSPAPGEAPHPSPHGEAPSGREEDPPQAIPGLAISGFVDASYFAHDLSGVSNSFGLDQVEIDISRELQGRGTMRVDLEWVNDGEGGFELDVEQGYVTFDLTDEGPVSLTFGKFNAPIGFELLDAPDMYQFSHALVFDYGLPTNLTGAMLSAQLSGGVDVSFYVSNGWDQNADLDSGKNVGGRIGFAVSDLASIGISGSVNGGSDGEDIRVFDVDVTVNASEALTLGGEFNRGTNTTADARYDWSGYLVMGHYDFTDQYGLTLRYDQFDDQDGSRLGSGQEEVRTALAIAPTLALGGGMGLLLEIRRERSDLPVFIDSDGNPTGSWIGVALEMTYSF